MPPTNTAVEIERLHFKALALANPNYFGTFKESPFPVVKAIAQNTSYEDLACVGFQPQLGQIEAVVRIARNAGYSGPLCSGGSREYVRFYLSFDGGASWEDQGMAQFAAYDTPGARPLDYAVTRPVNPPRKFCFVENLIKVRAILSWNAAPTPNTPDFTPVWGRVLDADIQVEPKRRFLLKELVEAAKIKLPPELVPIVNFDHELPVAAAAELTLEQKVAAAREARVPEHRFLFDTIQPYLAGGAAEAMLPGALPAQLKQLKIDLAKVIEVLIKTDGDTSFEQLTCIGYDPGNDALAGVIHVKKPAGYSGKLCSAGSREYVAFWIDWGAGWQYAGTSSVKVHDVAGLPGGGLRYAVFEAVDVSTHRKACQNGPVTAKVRAILSWQTPPPPANPNWVPTWGNREEATIQLGPGAVTDYQPIFESISSVPVCSINQVTGRTSGAYDQPFGGVLTITGLIPNAPDLSTPDAQKLRYRVQVRQWPGGTWQTVDNSFGISVIERIGAALPTQVLDPAGDPARRLLHLPGGHERQRRRLAARPEPRAGEVDHRHAHDGPVRDPARRERPGDRHHVQRPRARVRGWDDADHSQGPPRRGAARLRDFDHGLPARRRARAAGRGVRHLPRGRRDPRHLLGERRALRRPQPLGGAGGAGRRGGAVTVGTRLPGGADHGRSGHLDPRHLPDEALRLHRETLDLRPDHRLVGRLRLEGHGLGRLLSEEVRQPTRTGGRAIAVRSPGRRAPPAAGPSPGPARTPSARPASARSPSGTTPPTYPLRPDVQRSSCDPIFDQDNFVHLARPAPGGDDEY